MKRGYSVLIMSVLLIPAILAAQCDLTVSVLNQNPIPAVPGEKLEVVFTIADIDSNECGTIEFEVLDEFPFSVAPGFQRIYTFESGTFTQDYNTQKTIPVDFKVNEDALDGDNPLEVRYRTKNTAPNYISKTFDIEVNDVKADFEVFVSDYDYTTKELTFEVLNIGKSDIEAVTITVVNQEGIVVSGSNKDNIGDLSSNEDTSSDFVMDIDTNEIRLIISYSDSVNVRRSIEKSVSFDATLFEHTKATQSTNYGLWVAGAVVLIVVYYFYRKKRQKKK